MSIYSVEPLHSGRDGEISEGMERRYTNTFRVRTNSKLTGQIEVMYAPGIPRMYDFYRSFLVNEYDYWALCRSVRAVQDEDDWTVWIVTCQYSTASQQEGIGPPDTPGQPGGGSGNGGGTGLAGDVELEPPTIDWGYWTREIPQSKQHLPPPDDVPLLNSAKQPFDPVPTREGGGLVLTVERNEPDFFLSRARTYAFAVNDDDFLEIDDRDQWLSKPPTAKRVYKGPLKYWRVRYEFHHCGDLGTWHHVLLNAGYSFIDSNGNTVPNIVGGARELTLLKANGAKLGPAVLAATGPTYEIYIKYRREPFAPLKIKID